MPIKITSGIEISVTPQFRPEHSQKEKVYFFSYKVKLTNTREDSVRLLRRVWKITDAVGRVEEVKGAGVIGQQPLLGPGEEFEYESFCPLKTPTGTMSGSYEMITTLGEEFSVEIPLFFLAEPHSFH